MLCTYANTNTHELEIRFCFCFSWVFLSHLKLLWCALYTTNIFKRLKKEWNSSTVRYKLTFLFFPPIHCLSCAMCIKWRGIWMNEYVFCFIRNVINHFRFALLPLFFYSPFHFHAVQFTHFQLYAVNSWAHSHIPNWNLANVIVLSSSIYSFRSWSSQAKISYTNKCICAANKMCALYFRIGIFVWLDLACI